MEPLSGQNVCPNCGYDQNTASLASYLKPGTILHERYLVGKALSSNGEGITYIAYDKTVGCKVIIREYMPEQLCSRVAGSALINVDYDHLAQYKALMAEYTELNKALARQRSLSHLNPALDLISENNTTYAIFEYQEGRSLLDYLKENAGELSWATVRRIFPPFFTSLSLLHNAGVLHRGISPETIFVTDKGELKLKGFCISAVRTNDTELDAELFDGYAAPEQYFADRQQGTWTDVYGVCAVLYRILTGCRATDAISRQDFDNLIPPADVNPHVPESVSDAIMKGLTLDGSQRVRTITDLVTLLFEESDAEEKADATMQFRPLSGSEQHTSPENNADYRSAEPVYVQQRARQNRQDEPTVLDRLKAPLLITMLFLAIAAIVILVFTKILDAQNNSSNPANSLWSASSDNVVPVRTDQTTRTQKPDSIMPNIVGMNFPIKRDEMASFVELDPQYEFSETVPKDQIMWQELDPDTAFVSGSKVKVGVSRGTSLKEIPQFNGYRLQTYLSKLEEIGFVAGTDGGMTDKLKNKTKNKNSSSASESSAAATTTTENPDAPKQKVIYKATVDYRYANGNVCDVDPKPGTVVDLVKDYEIIIYYANNPVITTAATSKTSDASGGSTVSGGSTQTTSVTGQTAASTSASHSSTAASSSASQAPASSTKASTSAKQNQEGEE